MDISAVRQGLADAADAITGLTCTGYVPDAINEPAFMAGEVDIDFDTTFGRGVDTIRVACRVLVSRGDDKGGQSKLDGYLKGAGPTSLKAALQADRTLGGACHDLRVERVRGYRLYTVGEYAYFGAELTVLVIGSGT